MQRTYQRPQRGGFTLIELLTVISILGILTAILLPVYGTARRRGQQSACLSNMRQISAALHLYLQDYDGQYPAAVNPADAAHPVERWGEAPQFIPIIPRLPQFHQALSPYTTSPAVFRCPSDIGLRVTEPFPGWLLNASPSSYSAFGTSYFYHTELTLHRASEASITQPTETFTLMDADGGWHGDNPSLDGRGRRYTVLFADGHVRALTHPDLGTVWATVGVGPAGWCPGRRKVRSQWTAIFEAGCGAGASLS
jgi:prepilin-type N-terminal cleavage/methylation domain-containing protein/prepilin-type processing-associated H-X9-DG protein